MSLQVRLTLALVAFSLVPLAASMAGGFHQSRVALLASEKKGLEAVARLKAAELKTRVELHTRDAQRLSREFAEQGVGRGLGTDSERHHAWSLWIGSADATVDTSTDVVILDLQGAVRAASQPELVGQNWSGIPGIAAGRLRPRAVGPHRPVPGSRVAQDAVFTPLHVDGTTVAQLGVIGDEKALRSWLDGELPPGSRTIVTDLHGNELVAWPPIAGNGEIETVFARTELYPGGSELAVEVPVARVMRPFLFLRTLGVGVLVLLMVAAVLMAVMMARRIVLREQMLQNRLIHQEKLAAVGSLAAGVAHEIGNPLASLSSMVQVRLRRATDGGERADLELLLDHVDRINRTVKNLTRAARGSSGAQRPVLLQDLASRAVGLVRYDPRARDVTLLVTGDPSAPALQLDEDTWLQLLMNLLVNALDAVAGVPKAQITVDVAADAKTVVLEVADNGCGMSPDVLSRATDPLFTTKAPGSGTGLGLHLVADVAARHGGTLDITSKVGEGTSMRVTVPRKRRERFSRLERDWQSNSQS
jgi:signal transduction histidine kinase